MGSLEKLSYRSEIQVGDTGEITIYSGNKLRRQEAKISKVGEGERVSGLDIVIPLASLHAVRGTLTAKRDGHALNRGYVELLFADDRTEAQRAEVDQDGSFLMPYVLEGKYVLVARGGADVNSEHRPGDLGLILIDTKVRASYADAELPLTVAGEAIEVVLAASDVETKKVAAQ